jgi:hypothetical protein
VLFRSLKWRVGDPGPSIACNVLEKDKVSVIADPKTDKGKQGSWENLMTTMVDVSDKFVCKPRWKSPATGVYESVGVLDVYYVGPLPAADTTVDIATGLPSGGTPGIAVAPWIADNILVVEAFFTVGRTVVFGSDIQDICVLGWAIDGSAIDVASVPQDITKPAGDLHHIWANAMGDFVSCESLALLQRNLVGLTIPTGQDPLFVKA